MILKIIHTSKELLDEALLYFPPEYIAEMREKAYFQESLIGRYEISKAIGNNYTPREIAGIPDMYDENYWSLSHKSELIFFGVAAENIGVDIEIVKQRDISVLDIFTAKEYDVLGGKNWDNFYFLWTSHESMIKYDREINYTDNMYSLLSCHAEPRMISGLHFEYKLVFGKQSKSYTILSGSSGDHIYSICY